MIKNLKKFAYSRYRICRYSRERALQSSPSPRRAGGCRRAAGPRPSAGRVSKLLEALLREQSSKSATSWHRPFWKWFFDAKADLKVDYLENRSGRTFPFKEMKHPRTSFPWGPLGVFSKNERFRIRRLALFRSGICVHFFQQSPFWHFFTIAFAFKRKAWNSSSPLELWKMPCS